MHTSSYTFKPTAERMVSEGIYSTSIDGLYFLNRSLHSDDRGFFSEVARIPELERIIGTPFQVKQVNHARSVTNVVRGIHAEDWNKLVFITAGKCFCAVADVRPDSSTFGKTETFVLGFDDDSLQGTLYIPAGIGNSVAVLEGPLDYVYFVDRLYAERDPAGDVAIALFDPDLQIAWPIPKEQMIISDRDKNSVTLKERFKTGD